MYKRFVPFLWFVALLALAGIPPALAQETTAGIQGTVKDSSGAVIPKASVEVTSPALIGVKKMDTDQGYFRFANLPKGGFTGMAAADFDRDGKLDLYLCCYVYFQSEAQYTYASPYHDAQNGPPNFLFRNRLNPDGSGFLEDCTEPFPPGYLRCGCGYRCRGSTRM